MIAKHEDLAEAPQLAILDGLHDILGHALAQIAAHHPEIEGYDLVGLPPDVWMADLLAFAIRDLQRTILRYREAALDDARYRSRNSRVSTPPPKTFAE